MNPERGLSKKDKKNEHTYENSYGRTSGFNTGWVYTGLLRNRINTLEGVEMVKQGEWKKKIDLIHRALTESDRYHRDEQIIDDAILSLQLYIERLEKENQGYKKQLDNMYD